ncbi:MAG: hypothetical protein O3A75_09600, partial [Verrucomicrobia bacterium]|nr:hypothetical protein [Verrucomicrobiota bacterium]
DPDCRKPMVWDDLVYDPELIGPDGKRMGRQEVRFDRNLHAFFQAAIALRHEVPVFNTGGFRWLILDDAAGTLAFERAEGKAQALVVFNRSEQSQTVRLTAPAEWPEGEVSARFVSDGGSAVLRCSGGEALVAMAPWSAAVFLP